jgi:hypothetical protein
MIIDSHIDKELVQVLVTSICRQLGTFAENISKENVMDVSEVGEHFMFAVLKAVRDIADDEASETEMIGQIIFGVMHSSLQGAMFQAPPRYKRHDEKVVVN